MKFTAFLLFGFLFSGCVTDSPALHRDDTARVKGMGEEKAHRDLACATVKSGRPIRSIRMTDGSEPLFNEYRVWVEGCGKHITYVIACTDDDDLPCQWNELEQALLKE